MAPTDGKTDADSGLSIRGAAAAAASTSTASGTAATSGGDGGAAKPTTAKGAGGRSKIKLSLKPPVPKSPAKPSPKAVFDTAPLAANKDVKRASSAFAEAVTDSDESSKRTKPVLARNSSSGSRFDVKGKARASEEPPAAPTEDPTTLAALEALKQGQLPATDFEKSPRSPSPPAAADERLSEKRSRSPRPRSPCPRSPVGLRHPDAAFDTAGGLPYGGEPELPASGRTGEKSSTWDRPSSPPPRHGGDFDRTSARFQQEEDERRQRAIQMEAARYGNSRSNDRRPFETTPVTYRSGGYDYDGRYGEHRNRSGYSTQYHRSPTGPYGGSETLDYDECYDHRRSSRRHHDDDRSRRHRDPYRDSDSDLGARDDRGRDAHGDPHWAREDDQERPTKRPRRDSASSRGDAAPIHAKKRDRSMTPFTDDGSEEEGEIDDYKESILDDSSRQRVNDRLTKKNGHGEREGPPAQYGERDGDRQRERDRDREYERRPPAPPHLPSRPNPPNPSQPVPPRLAPPHHTPIAPIARDAQVLASRPPIGFSLPAPPHAVGLQPMTLSSSNGSEADRPLTHGAVLPPRPPPPPAAPLERPQAPYHPAVPIDANVSVADVTPVESAAPSRALPPAVPVITETVQHAPPAVRTQRPHEELWLRTLQPDEEIEGVFSAAATPAPFTDRKYVGCSHISEYTLQEKLGEGTFGVVWKGRRGGVDPATNMSADEEAQLVQRGLRVKRGDVVALKQIIFHNEGDGLPITSVREIRILKMLDHPNVVPVVDIAYEPADHANFKLGKTFMVFPYMDHDLAGLLENRTVRLETAHIKQYSKQLLEGTAYLHRNLILHRDMKAANLLINNQGQLMIADFGLARSIHKAEENAAYTSCVVTRWYRPPELLLGEKRYHTPVDMWGVACVMAEMYQRSPIFPGQSDFDQAAKIFAACGPPTSESMPGWEKLPGVEGHEKYMWPNNGRSIRAVWSTRVDELFGDLIDRILVLDPKKRLTAEEALDHDWFWTEPYPTHPARMPQYKASHEMDGRKRKEEQHAAFGAVPMQPPMPPFPQQQQPNGMRPNGPIPAYGAPPSIPAYNGGQVAVPPPVGVFNGPPPPTMAAAHGYPGPQQQPPPPQMGGYGAAGPGPSGMAAGMGMGGGGGFRPPPPPPHGGHNHHHNRSYAAPGPPTAGRGMQPRRMGPGGGAGQYEGMRQGPSWNPNLPARPSGGPPAKVNLKDMLKRQR